MAREGLNDFEGLRPDEYLLHAWQHDDTHTAAPDPTPKAPVTSDKLFGEGYIPVLGFQPHTVFSSIQGTPLGQRSLTSSDISWR